MLLEDGAGLVTAISGDTVFHDTALTPAAEPELSVGTSALDFGDVRAGSAPSAACRYPTPVAAAPPSRSSARVSVAAKARVKGNRKRRVARPAGIFHSVQTPGT